MPNSYSLFLQVQSSKGLLHPEQTLFSIGAPQTSQGVRPHFWYVFFSFTNDVPLLSFRLNHSTLFCTLCISLCQTHYLKITIPIRLHQQGNPLIGNAELLILLSCTYHSQRFTSPWPNSTLDRSYTNYHGDVSYCCRHLVSAKRHVP